MAVNTTRHSFLCNNTRLQAGYDTGAPCSTQLHYLAITAIAYDRPDALSKIIKSMSSDEWGFLMIQAFVAG